MPRSRQFVRGYCPPRPQIPPLPSPVRSNGSTDGVAVRQWFETLGSVTAKQEGRALSKESIVHLCYPPTSAEPRQNTNLCSRHATAPGLLLPSSRIPLLL